VSSSQFYTDAIVAKAIGIDIGGTFIDLVISDASELRFYKFPSTPVGNVLVLSRLTFCN